MTRPGVPIMDLRAGAQAAELPLIRLAAVDRQLAHAAFEEGELRDLLGDLHGERARRAQDEAPAARASSGRRPGWRESQRRRFAGTGLRLPDDIRAPEQDGKGGRLNGRSLLEAHPFDGLQDLWSETHLRK